MNAKLLLVTLSLGLAVSACSKADRKNVREAADDAGEAVEETVNEVGATTELNGTWRGECERSALIPTAFARTELNFGADQSVERRQIYHLDEKCKKEAGYIVDRGTFDAGKELENGRAINLKFKKTFAKLQAEEGRGLLETAVFCGREDWTVGEEVDVSSETGTTCGGQEVPYSLFQIYDIEDGKLYLGNDEATSEEDRPTDLDRETVYSQK